MYNVRNVLALIILALVFFVLPGCKNDRANKVSGAQVEAVDGANENQEDKGNNASVVAVETPTEVAPIVVPPAPVGISPIGGPIGPTFPIPVWLGGGGGGRDRNDNREVCQDEKKNKKHDHSYLLVWAADQGTDDGVQNSDFLAVIDADPESDRFGEVVNTGPLPCIPDQNLINELNLNAGLGLPDDIPSCTYNESHHMSDLWTDQENNRDYIFAGGLINANIFRNDVT